MRVMLGLGVLGCVTLAASACRTDRGDDAPMVTDASAGADAGSLTGETGADAAAPAPRLDFGVTFSPIGFGGPVDGWLPQRAAFYEARQGHGRVVAFHFGWRDDGPARPDCGALPGITQLLDADTKGSPFSLSIVLGWSSGDGVPDLGCAPKADDNSWANAATREQYKKVAVAIAARYQPAYLFLGNEVNTWYLTHGSDWGNWVSELADVAAAVRTASPSTAVGTTYQWEHLRGGGTKNGWRDPPQWSLIDDVIGKIDILGLTTYPYFDFDSPAAVPGDHYEGALTRFPGPIAITELAWRSEARAPYAGSPGDQSAWPALLLARFPPGRLRYATYLFLNEPLANAPPFTSTALRDVTGAPRAADAVWQGLVRERQSP